MVTKADGRTKRTDDETDGWIEVAAPAASAGEACS